MNYYMPYSNINPYITSLPKKAGLLSGIFKNGINWGSILTNTQKTLNIINQTIPVIKQVRPVITNAKTMFKIMNEFKKVETPTNQKNVNSNNNQNIKTDIETKQEQTISENNYTNNPTFFL